MNVELIRTLLSNQRVHHTAADGLVFDFGASIQAGDCAGLGAFRAELLRLCEHPEFTTEHLRELLTYLED